MWGTAEGGLADTFWKVPKACNFESFFASNLNMDKRSNLCYDGGVE